MWRCYFSINQHSCTATATLPSLSISRLFIFHFVNVCDIYILAALSADALSTCLFFLFLIRADRQRDKTQFAAYLADTRSHTQRAPNINMIDGHKTMTRSAEACHPGNKRIFLWYASIIGFCTYIRANIHMKRIHTGNSCFLLRALLSAVFFRTIENAKVTQKAI